ncbi:MAG: hypothetical protein R2800_13280 [Flavipsychrobacter sp.]
MIKSQYFLFLVLLLPLAAFGQGRGIDAVVGSGDSSGAEKILVRFINIEGNRKTRASIIYRELSISPDTYVANNKLAEVTELNRKRVFNLSLFTEAVIRVDTVDTYTVDWTIIVKEQWYIIPEFTFKLADRNFNVWWEEQNHDIRRANIGVTLKDRNFRGNLEQLSITAQIGYTQRFGIDYFRPYVDKQQKHGFGFSFFLAQNEEKYYTTDSNKWLFARTPGTYVIKEFEVAGNYVYRPRYASRHLFELRYRNHRVGDTILLLNPEYYENNSRVLKLIELGYRYDLNKVDNWNYPLEGFKTVVNSDVRIGIEGMTFQAYLAVEAGYFKKIRRKWFYSSIVRGRLTFPEDQPYTYRSAMGIDEEYVRGYEYYVIDGSQYGLIRNNFKYELLNTAIRKIPIRYISVLPVRLYPKIFTDVGYGRNKFPGNSSLNNQMLYSAGFGLDVVSAYDFKLRLEYTFNHLGEKGLFLHLSSE